MSVTILDQIEESIYTFRSENRGYRPTLIIMHPLGFMKLVEAMYIRGFYPVNNELLYLGIRVIRSQDIKETEILVR